MSETIHISKDITIGFFTIDTEKEHKLQKHSLGPSIEGLYNDRLYKQ